MVGMFLVAGLSDVSLYIFGGDLALLVTAVVFAEQLRKVMKRKESETLLHLESPMEWLKAYTKCFAFSLLSSLGYGIANIQTSGIESNPLIQYLFIFSVFFFLLGFLHTIRILWFIIDPSSNANIVAGKVMKKVPEIVVKGSIVLAIVFFQFINGITLYSYSINIYVIQWTQFPILYLYLPTLILSFLTVIPFLYETIFHSEGNPRFRYWVFTLCTFSPWFVNIAYTLLLRIGLLH
jgi:hypothetical protein